MVDQKFDAVIVDEGQDFQPNWWIPLEMINSGGEEGAMYVFFDPKQNLYVGQATSLPELGDPFQLPVNCRNTKLIAGHCSEILDEIVPTRDNAPVGIEPEIVLLEHDYEVKKRIERYVHEWINKGKLKPNQVALISPNTLSNSSLRGMKKIKGISLIDSLSNWKDGNGILYSTIKAFKGLEADAIVLFDIPSEYGDHFSISDFYVASSRAKHLLTVIKKI